MKQVKFIRTSLKHRVGRTSARHVMATTDPIESTHVATHTSLRIWVGPEERGRELDIVAVERPDCWLVIHVMPTDYRRSQS